MKWKKARYGKCVHCLRRTSQLTADHVFPKAWYFSVNCRKRSAHRLVASQPTRAARRIAARTRSWPLPPPRAANLSSVPARKSYDERADEPVAAHNRRLTGTTEPSILRLA